MFQQFAGHVVSLQYTKTHTDPHSTVANWLIEPSSHPIPMCAQFVLFNSYRKCRVETKLSLFLLFISGGKYTKATNSSTVLIRKTDTKVHPKPQKLRRTTVVYEAGQMKTSLSPGGGGVYS